MLNRVGSRLNRPLTSDGDDANVESSWLSSSTSTDSTFTSGEGTVASGTVGDSPSSRWTIAPEVLRMAVEGVDG